MHKKYATATMTKASAPSAAEGRSSRASTEAGVVDRCKATEYRRKAEELREIADELTTEDARRTLRTMAYDYQTLALEAEQRARTAYATRPPMRVDYL